MKGMLTAPAKRLLPAIATAIRAVENRIVIPILGCVRIEAADGKLRILGTNLNQWVETSCAAEGDLSAVCVHTFAPAGRRNTRTRWARGDPVLDQPVA